MTTINTVLSLANGYLLQSGNHGAVIVGNNQLSALGITSLYGVCADPIGNLYATAPDQHVIVKIVPNVGVSIVAGTLNTSGNDGNTPLPADEAKFNTPLGLASDKNGVIYIADSGNNQIRMLSRAGWVNFVAGALNGSTGFSNVYPGAFSKPSDVTVDNANRLFVADTNNHAIRMIQVGTESMVTVAGNGASGDVHGYTPNSRLNKPNAVSADLAGNIYIADSGNYKVKKLNRDFYLYTFSGNGSRGAGGGLPADAEYLDLQFVKSDGCTNVYVVDYTEGSGSRVLTLDGNGYASVLRTFDTVYPEISGIVSDRSRKITMIGTGYIDEFYTSSSSSSLSSASVSSLSSDSSSTVWRSSSSSSSTEWLSSSSSSSKSESSSSSLSSASLSSSSSSSTEWLSSSSSSKSESSSSSSKSDSSLSSQTPPP